MVRGAFAVRVKVNINTAKICLTAKLGNNDLLRYYYKGLLNNMAGQSPVPPRASVQVIMPGERNWSRQLQDEKTKVASLEARLLAIEEKI